MREWDAQAVQRQEIILSIILDEVRKVRGIDSTKNNADTFENPFNDNLNDLEDLGIRPNEVLHSLANQHYLHIRPREGSG